MQEENWLTCHVFNFQSCIYRFKAFSFVITDIKQSPTEREYCLFPESTQSASHSLQAQVCCHGCLHHNVLRDLFMFLKILTKLYKTLEVSCCSTISRRIFFFKVTFCTYLRMRGAVDAATPMLHLPQSWSPYQLLHVVLCCCCDSEGSRQLKEGWAVRGLFPLPQLYMGLVKLSLQAGYRGLA